MQRRDGVAGRDRLGMSSTSVAGHSSDLTGDHATLTLIVVRHQLGSARSR
jgi:hypothetical protein